MSLTAPFRWLYHVIYRLFVLSVKIFLFVLAVSAIWPVAVTLFHYLRYFYNNYETTISMLALNYFTWHANRDLIAQYQETYFYTTRFCDSRFLDFIVEKLQRISIYLRSSPDYVKYNLSLRDYGDYDFMNVNTQETPRVILTKLSREVLGKQFNPPYLLNALSANSRISRAYIVQLQTAIDNGDIQTPVDFKVFNIKYFYPDVNKLNARLDSYHLAFLEVTINTSKGLDRFLNYWIDRGHYLSFQKFNRTFSNSLEFGPFKNFDNKKLLCYVASVSYDIQEFLYNLKNMKDIGALIQSPDSSYDLLFKSRIFHHNYLRFKNPKCCQPNSNGRKSRSRSRSNENKLTENKNIENKKVENKNIEYKPQQYQNLFERNKPDGIAYGSNYSINGLPTKLFATSYDITKDIPMATTGTIQVTPVLFDRPNLPAPEPESEHEEPEPEQEQYQPYNVDKDNDYYTLYITDDFLTVANPKYEDESFPVLVDSTQEGSYVGETYLYFEGIKACPAGHGMVETFFDGKETHRFPYKFVDFTIQLDGKIYHQTLSVIPYDVDPGFTFLLGQDFLNILPTDAPKPKKRSELPNQML